MTSLTPSLIEAATALAIVSASHEPLLYLSEDLRILAISASFCRTFQLDSAGLTGRLLSELGSGEWGTPKLLSLLRATASGGAEIAAYEMDLDRAGRERRRLVVHAHRLLTGFPERVQLLVAISDVTLARSEARLKDDLIREKEVLIQEVQHRVANSLQIIASVLMQSARKVQSEEARGYLRDAHLRVLSIAEVQRHLALANTDDVTLRPYFVQLCESLGASMIFDPTALSIAVTVDDSVVDANKSVSLGLIVTELVINALKHAFPRRRPGKIRVDYHSDGLDWRLSVTDDGIGIDHVKTKALPGLGTGIVQALARHLHARVEIIDAHPGASVRVSRMIVDGEGASPAAA